MKNILLVVDVQNGFTRFEQTKKMAEKIEILLRKNIFDFVIASRFENFPNSIYTKLLNWNRLISEEDRTLCGNIETYVNLIVPKTVYTCVSDSIIAKLKDLNSGQLPSHIFIAGIDTDCCVLKTAADIFELGIRPIVLSQYCSSNGGEPSHQAGLLCLKRLIGENNIYSKHITSISDLDNFN